jgi:hypothetical protein
MSRLYNAEGAASYLKCTVSNIHYLVGKDKLQAHIFDDKGELVKRQPGEAHQGQSLHFYAADLNAYRASRKKGAPFGNQNAKAKEKPQDT